MGTLHAKQVGYAGEHLVMADLLMQGFNPSLVNDLCHFDIMAERDECILRIEVKTTAAPRNESDRSGRYKFQLVHRRGWGHREDKLENECDLLAFAFLDIRKVAYMAPEDVSNEGVMKSQINFRSLDVNENYRGNGIIEHHLTVPEKVLKPRTPF